jgi:hypothetical protein
MRRLMRNTRETGANRLALKALTALEVSMRARSLEHPAASGQDKNQHLLRMPEISAGRIPLTHGVAQYGRAGALIPLMQDRNLRNGC